MIKCKESDHWSSPAWILKMFEGWYDPTPLHAEIDSLNLDWKDKTYCNPPYSNPKPFIEKAIEENKKGKTIALLLPVDTTTEWFRLLVNARAHILFPNERLRFGALNKPARWGCLIAFLYNKELGGKNDAL